MMKRKLDCVLLPFLAVFNLLLSHSGFVPELVLHQIRTRCVVRRLPRANSSRRLFTHPESMVVTGQEEQSAEQRIYPDHDPYNQPLHTCDTK